MPGAIRFLHWSELPGRTISTLPTSWSSPRHLKGGDESFTLGASATGGPGHTDGSRRGCRAAYQAVLDAVSRDAQGQPGRLAIQPTDPKSIKSETENTAVDG